MIIAQGWKDGRVHVLMLSRATNGFDGWQLYRGSYNANGGETFQNIADWECKNSSPNIVDLLYYTGIPEIATWVDGDKQVKPLQDVLLAIHAQCQQMAAYVKAACTPSSPS